MGARRRRLARGGELARPQRLSRPGAPMSDGKPARPMPLGRSAFGRFVPVSTRWSDNDSYGHINNAAYYFFFDTAVNALLIEAGLLDPAASEIIGLVVES